MKNFKLLVFLLLILVLLLNGCALSHNTGKNTDKTSAVDTESLRVLISSDIHYQTDVDCYGIDMKTRAQHWVDNVLAEHKENPIDLLVINGDLSLDYENIFDNSIFTSNISRTKEFIDEYLSQLPDDLPVFIMPGNHELYSDESWYEITGNHRQEAVVVKNTLFLLMDNYSSVLDPDEDQAGVYTATDVAYIEEKMNEYPEYDTYIIAHYIDPKAETQNFRKLIVENERIKGMFSGHTHYSEVIELGEYWENKTIAQTGHFSYVFSVSPEKVFWGFRELVITRDEAYSQYITVKSDAIISGKEKHFERETNHLVRYE